MLKKIRLLPTVEVCIEGLHQRRLIRRFEGPLRRSVQLPCFLERRHVERAAHFPRCIALGPERDFAEVFEPGDPCFGVVSDDVWNRHTERGECLGCGEEAWIVRAGVCVDHDDDSRTARRHPFEAKVAAI